MVTITLTTAGANTSATFDLYWSADIAGPWIFFANVSKIDLLAGYTFVQPDPTAVAYQVRDTGDCETILTLSCPSTTTTTTTDPLATTTTTTTDPLATTTTTTTENPDIIPDHIWAPNTGGTYSVTLVYANLGDSLSSVDEEVWFTSSVNPTPFIYTISPLRYYNVMTVVVDANSDPERLGQINVYNNGVLWGVVYMREDGV